MPSSPARAGLPARLPVAARRGFAVGRGTGAAESLAVGRGCRGKLAPERAAHRLVGAEATRAGDRRERLVAALQADLGGFDADAFDVTARGDAQLALEDAREVADAESGALAERLEGVVGGRVAHDVVEHVP